MDLCLLFASPKGLAMIAAIPYTCCRCSMFRRRNKVSRSLRCGVTVHTTCFDWCVQGYVCFLCRFRSSWTTNQFPDSGNEVARLEAAKLIIRDCSFLHGGVPSTFTQLYILFFPFDHFQCSFCKILPFNHCTPDLSVLRQELRSAFRRVKFPFIRILRLKLRVQGLPNTAGP